MKALDEITILTTATLRPKITERTFTSFNKNMFKEYTGTKASILNIDLIGEQDTGMVGKCFKCSSQSIGFYTDSSSGGSQFS